MQTKNYLITFVLLLQLSYCDDSKTSFFITGNTNLFIPNSADYKTFYPINKDKTMQPKLGLGGFGLGIFALKPLKNHISLKGYFELDKQRYKESPIQFRDISNTSQGTTNVLTSNYNVALGILAHYNFNSKFSGGLGLGGNILLLSRSNYDYLDDIMQTDHKIVLRNKNLKKFMPLIPLEFQYAGKKLSYTVRFEKGISNYFRNDLKDMKTLRFNSLYFILGYRIK